jgi:curli biogenesis system outer membrane secretion channel CsgG
MIKKPKFLLVSLLCIPLFLPVSAGAASLIEIPAPVATVVVLPSTPALKRKISIARFSNATRYGKALLIDGDRDPLADQAADMLSARLVESGKFLVFERDVQALNKGAPTLAVGVDALIVGSVTEFGRKIEGQSGFLNSKMRQTASATVEVRLVDALTGQSFFSTRGVGSASITAGEVAGFGSSAGYDSTLNDRAISAAISDLMTNVMNKLQERRWYSDVLRVRDGQVFLSGGAAQGLKIGDKLDIETRGEVMVSGQTGLPITLPGSKVAAIELIAFFGDEPSAQGAIGRLISGQIPSGDPKSLIVVEAR